MRRRTPKTSLTDDEIPLKSHCAIANVPVIARFAGTVRCISFPDSVVTRGEDGKPVPDKVFVLALENVTPVGKCLFSVSRGQRVQITLTDEEKMPNGDEGG